MGKLPRMLLSPTQSTLTTDRLITWRSQVQITGRGALKSNRFQGLLAGTNLWKRWEVGCSVDWRSRDDSIVIAGRPRTPQLTSCQLDRRDTIIIVRRSPLSSGVRGASAHAITSAMSSG